MFVNIQKIRKKSNIVRSTGKRVFNHERTYHYYKIVNMTVKNQVRTSLS